MKNLIIGVLLFSTILLYSCKKTDTDNIEKTNTENIELMDFAQSTGWGIWDIHSLNTEHNVLRVINSEREFKSLFQDDAYIESGIDFEKHTLLLVVVTTSVPSEKSYMLQKTENGYAYHLTATIGQMSTQIVDVDVCAVLAPKIGSFEPISFYFEIEQL